MNELSPNQLDALDRVQREPALQPFFFRKLKGVRWLAELQARGFLAPENNPKPGPANEDGYVHIPTWPILEYLESTAPELAEPVNVDPATAVMDFVRAVTRKAIDDDDHNYRTWWHFGKILRFLPVSLLDESDVALFRYWVQDPYDRMLVGVELGKGLLPRLLESNEEKCKKIALGVLDCLTELSWVPKQHGQEDKLEAHLPIEPYHSREALVPIAKQVGERLELEGVERFKSRIVEILEKTGDDGYSTLWRPAIQEHEQNHRDKNAIDILISAFREALIGYVDRRASAATEYVRALINSNMTLLQRVGIYAVGRFPKELAPLVLELIDAKFLTSQYRHEQYHFLRKCFPSLEPAQKERLFKEIGDAVHRDIEDGADSRLVEQQEAYRWLIWLSAINGHGDESVETRYADKLQITGREPSHPDFSSYMESVWVGEVSPYKLEDLLSRSFEELLRTLEEFREEGGWRAPSQRGLAQALKEAIKAKPDHFEGRLNEMSHLASEYKSHVIEAFSELWLGSGRDNWDELLRFCRDLVRQRQDSKANGLGNDTGAGQAYEWLIGDIGQLIRMGTREDKEAFDPSLLPLALKLLVEALEVQEGESFEKDNDAVMVAINSPRGKCLDALVNLALRECRLADKKIGEHEKVWEETLSPEFEKEIVRLEEGNLEFVTLFANYLPNFLYMSKAWTLQHLPVVFDKSKRRQWLCAMDGYCYVNLVYAEVYEHLRDHSHIREGLDEEELKSRCREKLIQNIVISYIHGQEYLEDEQGILRWLIDRCNDEELSHVVWFLWTLRRDNEPELTEKVLSLWEELDRRADIADVENRRLLSGLAKLSVYFTRLDDREFSLLERAAPFADQHHDAYMVVEVLRRLVDDFPDRVAEIYLKMLSRFAPTYKQEQIEETVERLFTADLGVRAKANEICDRFLKRGVEFPAEVRAKAIRKVDD